VQQEKQVLLARELQVQQEKLDLMVLLVQPDLQEQMVLTVLMDRLVQPDCKDLKEIPETKVFRAQLAPKVQPVQRV
jgi:hypothetical protein